MTRIDGLDALAALMRQQVQSLRRPATQAQSPAQRTRERRGALAREDLAAVVSRRVRAVDRAGKDAPRKAFRLFLEAVLQAELGEELINDAAFHALVDDVLAQMDANPGLAQAMDRAAALLLAAD